jgi:hypothetical protein
MTNRTGKEASMCNSIMRSLIIVALGADLVACSSNSLHQGNAYATPDQAVGAFVTALRSNDLNGLVTVFGAGSERLFSSPDSIADKNLRADFLRLYDTRHVLSTRSDGSKVLVVGNDAWPLPIPLVKNGSGWAFDSPTGSEEIINRRIGRNELLTIQTMLAVGDAERDYYKVDRNGDKILEYAQKFRSTSGQRDGLYWRVNGGEPVSPLGELVATAAEEGYPASSTSLHGYRFRLLTGQGPAAQGGAYGYLVRKSQIGGFAVLAYPVEYGESGVMTFIVNHDGIVYQRDLGDRTQEEATQIMLFNPDKTWTRVANSDMQPLPGEAADAIAEN